MKKYKWENMSNSSINQILTEMKNEHEAMKSRISDILTDMKKLEEEYLLGNNTLIKRMKGEE
jgi:predicted  nucleic acid-binding Zn-ribbon protein